jgi:hypothetical protein
MEIFSLSEMYNIRYNGHGQGHRFYMALKPVASCQRFGAWPKTIGRMVLASQSGEFPK